MKGFTSIIIGLVFVLIGCSATAAQPIPADIEARDYFCDNSPFNQVIPFGTNYVLEEQIQSFRQNQEEWSAPIYRVDENLSPPPVDIANDYSDRVETWSIPVDATPATADDHHLIVVVPAENMIYEMWNARWLDSSNIAAGGMKNFPIDGTGISDPPNQRVTAAGFSVLAGMVIREDFVDPETGLFDVNRPIEHALSMSLHFDIVGTDTFRPPAVGGESQGRAGENGIPMGARFAIGSNMSDEALEDLHPLTRAMAIAARDYGIYVNDTNSAPMYEDGYVGNVRVEVGLMELLFGKTADALSNRVQREIGDLINLYGFYRLEYPDPEALPCEDA